MAEFCREAQLMISVKPHINVVRVYGLIQEVRNLCVLVFSFIDAD